MEQKGKITLFAGSAMCGIAGFVNLTSSPPSIRLIKAMTDALSYRGPDDGGLEIHTNCALGNRRLAVVDLSSRGHQPLWDPGKNFCITYNGEIYNFLHLRRDLKRKGYRFRSDSDTEVIVNLYQEYGQNCVAKLEGMFALAIWDARRKELFFARDPFGIKPFHYYMDSEVFIFASEIKSILLHPKVKREINLSGLSQYFSLGFGCVASPETLFRNIKKLPPGYVGSVKSNTLSLRRYFRDLESVRTPSISFDEAVEETRRLLVQSVKQQLIADVPLGVFLSGGIDSSLIAAIAQEHTSEPIKTFSIGFVEKNFDESAYAHRVADHLGTDHHQEMFTSKQLLSSLDGIVSKLDEPVGDPSMLPTYLLAKMTRRSVTVALSGDGGDELFAGYPTYIAHSAAAWLQYLPRDILNGVSQILPWLEPILEILPLMSHAPTYSSVYKLQRFLKGIHKDISRQYIDFLGPMALTEKAKLLKDAPETALPLITALAAQSKRSDRQTKLQYLDLMIYLAEDCLQKTDRASSYNSLEVRVPFLDRKLATFAFSLPSSYHTDGFTLKRLLKRIAVGYLPKDIIQRPKKGFGLPTHSWLRNELRDTIGHYLSEKRISRQGLFNERYVERILAEHQTGNQDHRMLLWSLLVFQMWYDRWVTRL